MLFLMKRFIDYIMNFSFFIMGSTTRKSENSFIMSSVALAELCPVWERNPDEVIVRSSGLSQRWLEEYIMYTRTQPSGGAKSHDISAIVFFCFFNVSLEVPKFKDVKIIKCLITRHSSSGTWHCWFVVCRCRFSGLCCLKMQHVTIRGRVNEERERH